jgi:hypothetical protein
MTPRRLSTTGGSDRAAGGSGRLGDARPGADSDWTPGASTSETTGVSDLGGRSSAMGADGSTGSARNAGSTAMGDASTSGLGATGQGDQGNRSGSGSGGLGESDQDLGDTTTER